MQNIKGIVNSLTSISNRLNNITDKIKVVWVYSTGVNATKPVLSITNGIITYLNLNNIIDLVPVQITLNGTGSAITDDTNLVESLNNTNIKYYIHNFGSTLTQILQTDYFIDKPNVFVLNGYSTAPTLSDRSNLLRFSSSDSTLMILLKKYLKNPYNESSLPANGTIEYIILTDTTYNNPTFVNNYVNLLKNKITEVNQNYLEKTYIDALGTGFGGSNLRTYINSAGIKTKVIFFVSQDLDPITEHLYNSGVSTASVGFFSSDAMLNTNVSSNTKTYLNALPVDYPQFIISNATYDTEFINDPDGGNGDQQAELTRNMISFILYKHYTDISITQSFIDQRFFTNKDNSLGAFNLFKIDNPSPVTYTIDQRCAFADTEQTKGSYSLFENV